MAKVDSKLRTFPQIKEKNEKVQCAVLLHEAGKEARAVFNTFDFDKEGDQHKGDIVKDKFKKYCEPRNNLTFIGHQFFKRSQGPTETIDAFATDLKNKRKHCEYI